MLRLIIAAFLLLAPAGAQPTPLKVAAVQMRSSSRLEENRRRIVEVLARLAAQGVQVAAFPECALTGYDKDTLTAATKPPAAV